MTHEIASDQETKPYYEYKKSLDIWNKLHHCRWAVELKKLEKLQNLYFIFEENYKELQSHLCKLEDSDFVTGIHDGREQNPMQKIQWETTRYLFNYLSSAISLYDQILSFGKKDCKPELDASISSYVGSSIPIGIVAFVRKLRNILIHDEIPSAYLTLTRDRTTDEVFLWRQNGTLTLPPAESLSRKWSEDSLQFLKTLPNQERINVMEIVAQHHEVMSEFFHWFDMEVREQYQEEIEEYNTLEKEYNREVDEQNKRKGKNRVHQLRESLKLKRCKKTDKRLHK